MALTKAQIRDRAAGELGILMLGQALANQNVTRIEQAYDEVYEQLKIKSLATWASTDSVPNELVPHIIAMVAYNCLGNYGVSNDRYNRIVANYNIAERSIKELIAPDYISQEDPTDY